MFFAELIKESRLTTLQRKSLQGWLRSHGDSPSTTSHRLVSGPSEAPIKRFRSTRPRMLKDIVESGAYEPEAYKPSARQSKHKIIQKMYTSIKHNTDVRIKHYTTSCKVTCIVRVIGTK